MARGVPEVKSPDPSLALRVSVIAAHGVACATHKKTSLMWLTRVGLLDDEVLRLAGSSAAE